MARGRKAKPSHLKLLEGNPGKRPVRKSGPQPRPITPTKPGWLLREAKCEWTRVVPELERLGLLTVIDRAALACYCQSYARMVEAEAVISEKGSTYRVRDGGARRRRAERADGDDGGEEDADEGGLWKMRPEVAIAMKERQAVRLFCSEFGLTPSSRGRMSVGEPEDDGDMEGLLR